MGKLVDFGPGEITDRLTILALKILFGQKAGRDCAHWQTERAKLLPQIRSRTLNGTWFEQTLELAAVNAAIWHKEDDLRETRLKVPEPDWKMIAWLGIGLQELNDQRAGLIASINEKAGEKSGQEKL